MPVTRVSSLDDPALALYRALADSGRLAREGLFVAEGRLVVSRLLERRHPIVSLLLNDASLRALAPWLPPDVPVYLCRTADFSALTGFNLHRGCLALAARPAEASPAEIASAARLLLVLEAVADADNVGSAFRNAAAFGAGGVLLSPGCGDPLYRKAVRTSVGCVLRVPFARVDDWPGELRRLQAAGFVVAALTPQVPAEDISRWRPGGDRRLAVLVGREGDGLTPEALALADVRLRIPLANGVDSLNLATAAGIALHRLTT